MNKQEAEKRSIIIYWWNMGKKTLDFRGDYKDFFLMKEIKIRKVKENFYKITFSVGTSKFIIQSYTTDFIDLFNIAIKSFLVILGDKTKFIDGYNREYQINWR